MHLTFQKHKFTYSNTVPFAFCLIPLQNADLYFGSKKNNYCLSNSLNLSPNSFTHNTSNFFMKIYNVGTKNSALV